MFKQIKQIIMERSDYNKYMGYSSVDIGSKAALLKQCRFYCLRLGMPTGPIYNMKKPQLYQVYKSLKAKFDNNTKLV